MLLLLASTLFPHVVQINKKDWEQVAQEKDSPGVVVLALEEARRVKLRLEKLKLPAWSQWIKGQRAK